MPNESSIPAKPPGKRDMATYTTEEILAKVEAHGTWVMDQTVGQRSDFTNADLTNVTTEFRGRNLTYAWFDGSDLTGVDFSNAILQNAEFVGCNLSSVNFSDCNMGNADLASANLSLSILTRANIQSVNLEDTTGNGIEIRSAAVNGVNIIYTATHIQITDKIFLITEWNGFSDNYIESLGTIDPVFWTNNKAAIQSVVSG